MILSALGIALLSVSPCLLNAQTAPATSGDIIDFGTVDASAFKVENGATASIEDVSGAKAVKIAFQASNGYPGVDLPNGGKEFNLSGYTSVTINVTNNSSGKLGVGLRVDNPGDWRQSPWNSEVVYFGPGTSGEVKVTFGQSFGNPGYKLDPEHVKNIKIMIPQPKTEGSIVVTSVKATK